MKNPHVLLPFGPKTKGGNQVYYIALSGAIDSLQCLFESDREQPDRDGFEPEFDADYFSALWCEGKHPSNPKYDLVKTNHPPYAPQPYTLWEDARKLERYEKALKFYADKENWMAKDMCCETREPLDTNSPCGLCDNFYQYNHIVADKMGATAREALKGGDE